MNDTEFTPTSAELHQASIDALVTVARERLDRIIDLESDNKTYFMLASGALYSVAELTRRNKQLARRNDELNAQMRAAMAAPCLACRQRQRADAREMAPV